MKEDYSEIFTKDSGITFLESYAAEFWLEVTLNHPRVKVWENLTSSKQCNLYLKKLHDIKNCLGFNNLEIVDYAFEVSKDGHFHCHALLHSTCAKNHFPLGVIADCVKTYLNTLPKKYSNYKRHCMYDKYYRYNGPGCCIQYRFPKETERIEFWGNYIKKYSKV